MPVNPAVINLSALGSRGFRLNGRENYDNTGITVSAAGDVNGDGFDDFIIGAPTSGSFENGTAYLVFGKAEPFPSSMNLAGLNGTTGVRIIGLPDTYSSNQVSTAGDFNGDGFDDVILSGSGTSPNGTGSGSGYVVFGKAAWSSGQLGVAQLNGVNGFRISGAAAGDYAGVAVTSAGDINGDGLDDLLIGASGTDFNGANSGSSYIVFGNPTGFNGDFNLANINGSNGFRIGGLLSGEKMGNLSKTPGDINGDGFDDVVVSGYRPGGPSGQTASAYVIFGKSTAFTTAFNAANLNGNNGFRINGETGTDDDFDSLSFAGDINNDGYDDLLIGYVGGANGTGTSYVVFGKAGGFDPVIQLSGLNGSNGFRLVGSNPGELSGGSVSAAGDINGDGFGDLIIGAVWNNEVAEYAGASYVVFGTDQGFAAIVNLSTLNGTNGFKVLGASYYDYSGCSVSAAGDVNGDGFDDILIGARFADPNGGAGAAYVIYGRATGAVVRTGTNVANNLFGGDYNDTLNGLGGNDTLEGRNGLDSLIGGTGRDTLIGGRGRDTLTGGTSGDRFKFAAGDSGQLATTMDRITDFAKGALNVGDTFDFTSALTRGGSGAGGAATSTRASINQTTGVATFAAGSGTTLADALSDIATRWTLSTDSAGEFALFRVNNTGAYHIFVSDGVAGVTANDVLVQLSNITTINTIDLTGGNLTILT